MIEIKSKKECCGCTACSSICPKKCIDMKEDNEGFIYPNVNVIECIDCKLCEQVCPMTKKRENEKEIPESILARDVRESSLDGNIRKCFYFNYGICITERRSCIRSNCR